MTTMLLTVRQPFASKIISGTKTIENRTRKTNYRGRLGIHAGAAIWPDLSDREVALAMAMPRAAVLGTVNLIGCHETTNACYDTCDGVGGWMLKGYYHWELENAREFVTPIRHVKGQLGIWEALPTTEHLMSIAEVADHA